MDIVVDAAERKPVQKGNACDPVLKALERSKGPQAETIATFGVEDPIAKCQTISIRQGDVRQGDARWHERETLSPTFPVKAIIRASGRYREISGIFLATFNKTLRGNSPCPGVLRDDN